MTDARSLLRTHLLLARASNLPTVWSNCVAGWLAGGGGVWTDLGALFAGASLLYTGGMYLNDAFDAQFDRQHRPERPIPRGWIQLQEVWAIGFTLLGSGVLCLFLFPTGTMIFTLLLSLLILIYDIVHKMFALSPVLMAGCRTLLILVAASIGVNGIDGGKINHSVWNALAMGLYVLGLSYLARRESFSGPVRYWPCIFLSAPLVLAFIVNQPFNMLRSAIVSAVITLWLLRCLWFAYWSPHRNVGMAVAGLLAGIPLVDLLSVWTGAPDVGLTFVALFAVARLFQRFIPAT
jgi:4-hydroxybenzoate polyprenyltransferase